VSKSLINAFNEQLVVLHISNFYMQKLGNYIKGEWITGDGDGQMLYDAINGSAIASATTKGLNFKEMLEYGRSVGGRL
jgi:hypothetical protein